MTLRSMVRELTPPIVMRKLRPPVPAPGGYISAEETVAAANLAEMSVCQYVERMWGQPGASAAIIRIMQDCGALSKSTALVVEIGAGTGRFIDATIKICRSSTYQVYETDEGWRRWLGSTYPILTPVPDGCTLRNTKSSSADLVHAHGVFVYTPLLVSLQYLQEIARVLAPGGFAVFNIISESCLTEQMINKWLATPHRYPAFLSRPFVIAALNASGLILAHSFLSDYGPGKSEYLVFRRLAVMEPR